MGAPSDAGRKWKGSLLSSEGIVTPRECQVFVRVKFSL